MPSKFELAIPIILAHEGGWVDDPNDAGGETMYGISMRFIKTNGLTPEELGLPNFDPGCLKALTKAKAMEVYRKFFWDLGKYDQINSQLAATKALDVSVNMGHTRAGILAQKACNALGSTLTVDGKLGPKSFAAINGYDYQTFVNAFCDAQLAFYQALVAAKPSQAVFLKGWTKRANWGRK